MDGMPFIVGHQLSAELIQAQPQAKCEYGHPCQPEGATGSFLRGAMRCGFHDSWLIAQVAPIAWPAAQGRQKWAANYRWSSD